MTAYMRWLERERGLSFEDYAALWQWSVDELEDFWASIWEYFEVESSGDFAQVLAERKMPGARWFEGAELNYAEHIFRGKSDDEVAVLHASELRELGEITWGELAPAQPRRSPPGCGISASARATASSPISPTAPRR